MHLNILGSRELIFNNDQYTYHLNCNSYYITKAVSYGLTSIYNKTIDNEINCQNFSTYVNITTDAKCSFENHINKYIADNCINKLKKNTKMKLTKLDQLDFDLSTVCHICNETFDEEIKGLKKLYPDQSFELTTRLKFMITSVEGSRESKDIREFVDKYLTAQDSRSLRDYYNKLMPDVDLKITIDKDGYTQEGVTIPIGINFFWPDSGV